VTVVGVRLVRHLVPPVLCG